MIYKIQLENFEGPLDLLLYFIRRDELDIYDIPIAKITKDFIDVIEEWKRANLILAGDFIVMASTLMRVKARMMIPRPELDEDGDIIDPREELMQQLIDYKRFREASDILKNMAINNSYSIRRQFEQELSNAEDDELEAYFKDITLYDLARKFKEAIESKPVISQFELNREPIRLEKQKELILKYFDGEGRVRFTTIINSLKSRMEIVVTFLAVLDLVRDGLCSLEQSDVFGEIEIFHLSLKS
tara:strand:- start:10055 stop:10783 length:729 start_codon:yes stop_codon:yes gene_type:complete